MPASASSTPSAGARKRLEGCEHAEQLQHRAAQAEHERDHEEEAARPLGRRRREAPEAEAGVARAAPLEEAAQAEGEREVDEVEGEGELSHEGSFSRRA